MTHTTFTLAGHTVTVTGPQAQQLAAEIKALPAQRDELLKALKDALRELAYAARQEAHDRAWAAITKAEGGAA